MAVAPLFPAGSKFYDVEGVPVSVEPEGKTLAWDGATGAPSRWFPLYSVCRNGTEISREAFLKAASPL